MDNDFQKKLFLEDIFNLQKLGIQYLGIELILKNDKNFVPFFENFKYLDTILYELKKYNFKIHIIISTQNHEDIIVDDSKLVKWNLDYQQLLTDLAFRLHSKNFIHSLTYGVDFQNIELKHFMYQSFLSDLQKKSNFIILYSSNLYRTMDCVMHQYSDAIGIFYDHEPANRYKKQARSMHPKLSKQFKNKKIFITHANIEGNAAKLKLQNLLRFWEFSNLSFLNMNSIYNQTVISRDSEFFGLKNDKDFLNYIQIYSKP